MLWKGGRKVEGGRVDLQPTALTPVFQVPSTSLLLPLSGSFLFGLSGLGFRPTGVCEKCLARERQPGASASSPSALIVFPSPGLDWPGKSKLHQETEYLFGLDGVRLAVNQKFSLTSSRKRQEVPSRPLAEAFSKSPAPSAPPPALEAGDPAQLWGGCWQH